MPRRESPLHSEMLQGTLDMLILRTLMWALPMDTRLPNRLNRVG